MNPLSYTPTEEVLKWKAEYDRRVAELEMLVQALENRMGELEVKAQRSLSMRPSAVKFEEV